MLNEIFKGMDNAAELINENFEKTNVEIAENENGYYVKFGNGFVICWREITFNRDTSVGVDNVPKPIVFEQTYPVIGGVGPASSGGYRERNDLNILGINNYHDRWSIGRSTLYSTWSGTGDFTVVVWAAGIIK